jgi:hypothetical protein
MSAISQRTALLRVLAPVVLLAACANVPAAASAGNQPSATAGVQSSAASPSSQQGILGRNGSIAWLITPQGLSLSEDLGRTFTQLLLPSQVDPAAVAAVNAAHGTTWLASVGQGRSIMMYARDSASGLWSAGTQLTPTWPSNLGGAETQPPSGVRITPGGAKQVLVLTQLALTHSVSIPRIFVSGDGGVTFAQRVLPNVSDLNAPWAAIAMSGADAVAVIGERMDEVIHSGDTGSTWAPSTVNGVAPATDFVVGTPVFAGSTIYLPVTESDGGDKGAFVVLRSTDGGAVFDALGAQTLPLGAFVVGAPPPVAAAGSTWWLVSPMTGFVYRSTDNGLTWSTAAAALPQGVIDIAATDSQNATVTIAHNACATGKTDCSSDRYSETTSDGGQTWTRI